MSSDGNKVQHKNQTGVQCASSTGKVCSNIIIFSKHMPKNSVELHHKFNNTSTYIHTTSFSIVLMKDFTIYPLFLLF